MKAAGLLLAWGLACFGQGQGQALSPTAGFDLNGNNKPERLSRSARSFFAATPSGLTLVIIDGGVAWFTSADLDGRILHAKSNLASVHAQIDTALPLPDGNFWLVSSGPNNLIDGESFPSAARGRISTGSAANYNQLDLYNSAGEHLDSVRLLSLHSGLGIPIAATGQQLVLRSAGYSGPSRFQLIHFGTIGDGKFAERTQVRVAPPVRRAISILASNGDLLLIDRDSGNFVAIDPKAKTGAVVQAATPHSIRAAASDSGFLYLLSGNNVLKIDIAGQVVSTYSLLFNPGFEPLSLGVTASSLYLVNKVGHAEKFLLN